MARTKTSKAAACRWQYDDIYDTWATSCGALHQFNDGGPRENAHRFCPYCGATLQASLRQSASLDSKVSA
jgi:hypothetical protein